MDFAFAGMTGLWLQPENFAGPQAEVVQLGRDAFPDDMRQQLDDWREDYPRVIAWVEALYREKR